MPFVKQAWNVAGWSRGFGGELRALAITGRNLVMFRTSAGHIVAPENRCPRRLARLSKGWRIGDTIRHRHHRMTFDATTMPVNGR